jgi:hypothetical protein
MDNLEKIDAIRNRMATSYEDAKRALESSNWDLVDALVFLEKEEAVKREEVYVRGNELVEKVKELVRKGNVTKIKVKQDDRILIEIPVTAGVVGALVSPQLAIIGTVAALVSKCTIEIERFDNQETYH